MNKSTGTRGHASPHFKTTKTVYISYPSALHVELIWYIWLPKNDPFYYTIQVLIAEGYDKMTTYPRAPVNKSYFVLLHIQFRLLNKYNKKLLELLLGCQNLQASNPSILKLGGKPSILVDIIENKIYFTKYVIMIVFYDCLVPYIREENELKICATKPNLEIRSLHYN